MRIAVIMAGGVGKRFWPYSRSSRPKQLLKIVTERSFLEDTISRIEPLIPREKTYIVTSEELKKAIHKEMPSFPVENIICEPEGRDTAACLALAEVVTSARHPDATMAVLSADHIIRDGESFRRNVDAACRHAEENNALVTLGIVPDRPDTGYGYVEAGEMIEEKPGGQVFRVKRFREKPDADRAREYVAAGNYFWNSGMFFWTSRSLRENLEKFLPETMEKLNRYRDAMGKPGAEEMLVKFFPGLKKISIDYAIMEKAENVCMVKADFDWDDLGTWNALDRQFKKDEKGNLLIGKGLLVDSEETLVYNPPRAGAPLVATFGLEDSLVVVADDVVMVCPKSRAPELKKLLSEVEKQTGEEYL